DRAGQIEEALVLLEIDKALGIYINGLSDRGHFDAVQVAPGSSSDVPDEAGGVRAVVLGVAHAHSGSSGSEALAEAKDILMQRGTTPRVYRNMLVFLAAEQRQLDNLKASMRSALSWAEIVGEKDRLNLTQSDFGLANVKLREANETLKTRLKEAWCYLIYPVQETAQADLEWTTAKVPAQDGLLARASKKLVSDEGLLPELGPARLDRELQKYIWNGKSHLHLKDLWEYLNRYTYMPRVKNREVLAKTVQAAVGGMLPGPFAYAERWDEAKETYAGLAIDHAGGAQIVIDSESVIIQPDVAERHRPAPAPGIGAGPREGGVPSAGGNGTGTAEPPPEVPPAERNPTRFSGVVMIPQERPARHIHQIIEAIVEQLTTLPGADVTLRLEIDADIPGGLDRAKVRTLIENATTLGFVEKSVR
ncbi:MAG: AAA family ATPase, partial [bacterium]